LEGVFISIIKGYDDYGMQGEVNLEHLRHTMRALERYVPMVLDQFDPNIEDVQLFGIASFQIIACFYCEHNDGIPVKMWAELAGNKYSIKDIFWTVNHVMKFHMRQKRFTFLDVDEELPW
jgi:hypothetical protein